MFEKTRVGKPESEAECEEHGRNINYSGRCGTFGVKQLCQSRGHALKNVSLNELEASLNSKSGSCFPRKGQQGRPDALSPNSHTHRVVFRGI